MHPPQYCKLPQLTGFLPCSRLVDSSSEVIGLLNGPHFLERKTQFTIRKERTKPKGIGMWEEPKQSLNLMLSFYIRRNRSPGTWNILAELAGS